MNLYDAISQLITYAEIRLGLTETDSYYAKNQLIEFLAAETEGSGSCFMQNIAALEVPDTLIEKLYELAAAGNKPAAELEFEHFAGKVMGFVSPPPSETERKFWEIYKQRGAKPAADYLYDFGVKNFYIQKTAISRNMFWETGFKPPIEVTINLSKPEKDNKDIRKLLTAPAVSGYPKCMLCAENLGYPGRAGYPARQTLRIINLTLGGEKWFMQYSPYAYYYQHCIAVSYNHTPMKVDEFTFEKLFDFIDVFPHFFIGSNAALPIVGGSILNHEHYQGGAYALPMRRAGLKKKFCGTGYKAEIYELDWYARSVRIIAEKRADVQDAAEKILSAYTPYSDTEIGLLAETTEKHNAVTVIAFKDGGNYCMDILFRNNRCDAEFPGGIYHAHPEYHNIKKEGIGLIEAAGLFILPGRLKNQLAEVANLLCADNPIAEAERLSEPSNPLHIHAAMFKELQSVRAGKSGREGANKAVIERVNSVCREILGNISVFKADEQGDRAFVKFMKNCGLKTEN